jgi:RNA polymerase sigma-70 factor (ECF subfamily)
MGSNEKESEIRRAELAAAVTRAASGDRQALRFVYDATSAKLFGVVLRILKDRSEAEDVLQEIYLTIWRKGGDFDSSRASPISWLVAIARNRAIDRLRSGSQLRRSAPLEEAAEVADLAPLASDLLEAEGERNKLSGCLDELEERQSQAIRAAFMDGFTYEQLAESANVPLGTMKSWIRRGLMRLRECLER